jgi:hypothetical protein
MLHKRKIQNNDTQSLTQSQTLTLTPAQNIVPEKEPDIQLIQEKQPIIVSPQATQNKILPVASANYVDKIKHTINIFNTVITIEEIIKYATHKLNTNFLSIIPEKNFGLIEKNVINFDNKINFIGTELFDIDNLIRFFSIIYIYDNTLLETELSKTPNLTNTDKLNIKNSINALIFSVIKKTMKILNDISSSNEINDNQKRELVLNYVVALTYKYTEYTLRHINNIKQEKDSDIGISDVASVIDELNKTKYTETEKDVRVSEIANALAELDSLSEIYKQ